ncbi:hypothetical protein GQ53DRAFT_811844 [Thozetella sp. PMI_491]|nr:hypothetical protein GQ53DRAFT_811844 [Thozetella sp. PMI_491]
MSGPGRLAWSLFLASAYTFHASVLARMSSGHIAGASHETLLSLLCVFSLLSPVCWANTIIIIECWGAEQSNLECPPLSSPGGGRMEHHQNWPMGNIHGGYPSRPVSPLSDVVESAPPLPSPAGGAVKEAQVAQETQFAKPNPRSRIRSWSDWWWKEILAVISSFAFQGAAVVILLLMAEKPYELWGFFVSLNATIAIFTTAAKATLLLSVTACISQWKWLHFRGRTAPLRDFDVYDEASRGSLGSFFLLFHFRWGIPAIGAIITILALGIDAFAQQVVLLEGREVFSTSPNVSASFAFSRNYSSDIVAGPFAGGSPIKATTDAAMHGAILRGLYNLEAAQPFNCSSRCRWDGPYISLGFQSSCHNVTLETMQTKICANTTESPNLFKCSMYTPAGVVIKTVWQATELQSIVVVNSSTTPPIPIGAGALYYEGSKGVASNLTNIAIFRAPSNYALSDPQITEGIIGEEVVECEISLAGYKYSEIEAVGTSLRMPPPEARTLGYGSPDQNFSTLLYTDEEFGKFFIAPKDITNVHQFFISSQFVGDMQDGNAMSTADGTGGAFINGSISDKINNMATSMTDYIRNNKNGELGFGLTEETVVFVRVEWEWLVLPLVVEVGAAILLIITMRQSRRALGVGLWKSSNTALLYHYVEGPEGLLKNEINSPEHLQELRVHVRAKLA